MTGKNDQRSNKANTCLNKPSSKYLEITNTFLEIRIAVWANHQQEGTQNLGNVLFAVKRIVPLVPEYFKPKKLNSSISFYPFQHNWLLATLLAEDTPWDSLKDIS